MAGGSDSYPDGPDPRHPGAAGGSSDALHQQLAVLAHDFNNELLGIVGNVGLARLDVPPASAASESLDEIEGAAVRATALVRRMLAVLSPAPATEPPPESPARRLSPSRADRASWQGRTVLLVDDEVLVRTVVTRMLEQLGVTVRSCATGAEALALLEPDAGGMDLVILDLALPDRSGESILAELVRRHVPTRVLLSSGFTDQWNEQRARAIGAAGFLGKPFMRAALEAALHAAWADPA